MTLREYISFWQKTCDKQQSRPTTYAAHNYVFKNHIIKNNAKILFIKEVKHFAYAPAELLAKSIFTY